MKAVISIDVNNVREKALDAIDKSFHMEISLKKYDITTTDLFCIKEKIKNDIILLEDESKKFYHLIGDLFQKDKSIDFLSILNFYIFPRIQTKNTSIIYQR
ncbi:hypothetical protein Bp8pS_301 [Bacillus phage vB_BpuM-BpSp]|nr:hypothetical protein Bp8pS_301 [Bacillus phage vB_BpuM-BpSp]